MQNAYLRRTMKHKTPPREFTGIIPADICIDPSDPKYMALKWERAHEKKRLAAYLKGKKYFSHGRHVVFNGYAPNLYAVHQERPA